MLDNKLKELRAKYKAKDFIPRYPLIVGVSAFTARGVAAFYFATLYFKRRLGVRFDRLVLPLWHYEDKRLKRYFCADGSSVSMRVDEGKAKFYFEHDHGDEEIGQNEAEDFITKDLERRYLYRYVKTVSPDLRVVGGILEW